MQKLILCTFCIIHRIEGDGKANNKCHSYIYLVSILPLLSHAIPLSVSSICTDTNTYTQILIHVYTVHCTCTCICTCECGFNLNSHGFFNSIKIFRFQISDFIFRYKSAIYSQLSIEKRLDLNFSITTLNFIIIAEISIGCFHCIFVSFFHPSTFLVSSLLFRLLFHPFFLRSLAVSFVDVI